MTASPPRDFVVPLRRRAVVPEKLGFLRFGRVGDGHVVTNDAGEFELLSDTELRAAFGGRAEQVARRPEVAPYAAEYLVDL